MQYLYLQYLYLFCNLEMDLSVHLSTHLYTYLSTYLSTYLPTYLPTYLSIYLVWRRHSYRKPLAHFGRHHGLRDLSTPVHLLCTC